VELKHEFEIDRPLPEVWTRLLDLRNVASALPGASVGEVEPDGTHHGTLRLKLGSFAAAFRGTARYTTVDSEANRVVLVANGSSAQGQAAVELEGQALPGSHPGSTRVVLVSRVVLSGRIANFGARLATDVARQVLDQFVVNLTATFEGPGATPASSGTVATGSPAATDALDLGSVLLPSWLSRPVPLPVAVGLAVAGLLVGLTLPHRRRFAVVPTPPARA
jgi:carbon monoxide dehydrogenase subunit G